MFNNGKVENGLLGGSHVKSPKGERSLLIVWRLISTNGSWHVSQGWDCWYFGCLTSIREDSTTKWRRFQKIQQPETCTYLQRLNLSTSADGCRQLNQADRQAVDRKSTETKDISVCRQLTRCCRQVAVSVEGFQQEIDRRPNSSSMCLSLSTAAWIFRFQFNFWLGFEKVSDSFLLRVVDWMTRMSLLKIWKV